ncbi:MAG: hypothetical protein Q8O98_01065 [bacterium]|nr:hypothetical protein [bacterium]
MLSTRNSRVSENSVALAKLVRFHFNYRDKRMVPFSHDVEDEDPSLKQNGLEPGMLASQADGVDGEEVLKDLWDAGFVPTFANTFRRASGSFRTVLVMSKETDTDEGIPQAQFEEIQQLFDTSFWAMRHYRNPGDNHVFECGKPTPAEGNCYRLLRAVDEFIFRR